MDVLKQADELDIDLGAVITLLLHLTEVHDGTALLSVINSDVGDILHHDAMLCGTGIIDPDGSYLYHLLNHNYPSGYFDAFITPEGRTDSPLSQYWRTNLEPIAFQIGRDDDKCAAEWVQNFKRYGLRNTTAHGVLDVRRKFGSYFIFSNIPGEVGAKEIFLLKLITPHLHFALMRVLPSFKEFERLRGSVQEPLTVLHKEILQWMSQGKTNWEISQILSMTENNVKYNIEQILERLEVRNRAQAVSKALLLGLLRS